MRIVASALIVFLLAAANCVASCAVDLCAKPAVPPCHQKQTPSEKGSVCKVETAAVLEEALFTAEPIAVELITIAPPVAILVPVPAPAIRTGPPPAIALPMRV